MPRSKHRRKPGRIRTMKLAITAAMTLLLALSTAPHAQPEPTPASDGLHTRSPHSVLDPIVQRCRALALTRRHDDGLFLTEVERAGNMVDLPTVFDAAAVCRQALSAHPTDRALIIAESNASFFLSLTTLGVGFPDSDEEAVLQALKNVENKGNRSRIETQILGFYLGSAYEYGVGIRRDRTEAAKWYAMAAQAGDPISKRELARLQRAQP